MDAVAVGAVAVAQEEPSPAAGRRPREVGGGAEVVLRVAAAVDGRLILVRHPHGMMRNGQDEEEQHDHKQATMAATLKTPGSHRSVAAAHAAISGTRAQGEIAEKKMVAHA